MLYSNNPTNANYSVRQYGSAILATAWLLVYHCRQAVLADEMHVSGNVLLMSSFWSIVAITVYE